MRMKALICVVVIGMSVAAGAACAADGEFDANLVMGHIGDVASRNQYVTHASPGNPSVPKSGVAVRYWGNNKERGRVEYKVLLEDGYPMSGVWYYDEPGEMIEREERFADGVRTVTSYHRNGGLKSEARYTIGSGGDAAVKDGLFREYNENGSISSEITYVNNVREGIEKIYDRDGNLMEESILKGGKKNGLLKEYYKNGKVKKEEPFTGDLVDGVRKDYRDDGTLSQTQEFTKGRPNGMRMQYRKNGTLSKSKEFKDGRPDGPEITYDTDGKTATETLMFRNGHEVRK